MMIFESPAAWETTFIDAQDTVPVLDMQIINNYDAVDKKVCIHVQTEYLVDMDRNLNIAVYITEDSIVGYQRNNNASVGTTPEITDYVFMHVLRGAVNSTWGAVLSNSLVTAGTKTITSYLKHLDPLWIPQHCHVVALVYDVDTDEILQAAEMKITP